MVDADGARMPRDLSSSAVPTRPPHAFSLDLGDGLALRLREPHHVAEYRALLEANLEHLQRWVPIFAPLRPEDADALTARSLELFVAGTGWEADLCEYGEVVGVIRLHSRSAPGGSSEVGYWVDAAHEGRGLVTRAMSGVLAYLFEGFGVGHVSLVTATDNERSRRVAERLGFELEAVMRRSSVSVTGEPVDQVCYGLVGEQRGDPGGLDTDSESPEDRPRLGWAEARFSLPVDDELKLAVLEREDVARLSELARRNASRLQQWMPWAADLSPEALLGFITGRALPAIAAGDGFEVGMLERGELVGMVGVHHVAKDLRRGEIGYWLDAGRYGNGIVTRCVAAVLARCFESPACGGQPFERIEIRADVDNLRSRAVAERLGFEFEGVLRRFISNAGAHRDAAVYSLLRDEWVARHPPDM